MRTEAPTAEYRPSALLLSLLLILLNFVLQPLTEPDFGWHLRTGLDLLDGAGKLPSQDPYSHTMPDWAWVEHAWLTDVIVAILYRYGGGLSVIAFFAGVTAAAWLLAARLADCPWHSRLLACCLSLWVALPYLGARTQLVSLLGLACVVTLLWRTSVSWQIIGMPILFLVWANLHGGFTAGLFLLGLIVMTASALKLMTALGFLNDLPVQDQSLRPALVPVALAAIGGFCLTFVNPYGWRLYAEIFDSLSDRYMLDTLQEWQPPSLDRLAGRSYLLYLGGLTIAAAWFYRRIEPVRWVLLAVFLVLSLRHMRNIPLFLLVSLPLCAELLALVEKRLCALAALDGPRLTRGRQAITIAAGILMLWLGPEHLEHVVLSGMEPARYFRKTSYPIEAVQWIQSNRDRLGKKMFNDYGHGGFLLWWLPDEKIFIDGRMPAWRIGDRRIFEDYVALTGPEPNLSMLDKYAVDWALVKRDSELDRALATRPEWLRAYEDRKVMIYRQRRPDESGRPA